MSKSSHEWLIEAIASSSGDRSAATWLAVKLAEIEQENDRLREEKSKLFFAFEEAKTEISNLNDTIKEARPRGNMYLNGPTGADFGKWFWLVWDSPNGKVRELGVIECWDDETVFVGLGKGKRRLAVLLEENKNIRWFGPVAAPPVAPNLAGVGNDPNS